MHTRRGRAIALNDLKKWIRLERDYFKVAKADVLARGDELHHLPELLETAQRDGLPLSLRTSDAAVLPELPALAALGLCDVFLAPAPHEVAGVSAWLDACQEGWEITPGSC